MILPTDHAGRRTSPGIFRFQGHVAGDGIFLFTGFFRISEDFGGVQGGRKRLFCDMPP